MLKRFDFDLPVGGSGNGRLDFFLQKAFQDSGGFFEVLVTVPPERSARQVFNTRRLGEIDGRYFELQFAKTSGVRVSVADASDDEFAQVTSRYCFEVRAGEHPNQRLLTFREKHVDDESSFIIIEPEAIL